MVISAIWSTLPGQNRVPYIWNPVYVSPCLIYLQFAVDCPAGLQGEGQAEEEADDRHLQCGGVRAWVKCTRTRTDMIHPDSKHSTGEGDWWNNSTFREVFSIKLWSCSFGRNSEPPPYPDLLVLILKVTCFGRVDILLPIYLGGKVLCPECILMDFKSTERHEQYCGSVCCVNQSHIKGLDFHAT